MNKCGICGNKGVLQRIYTTSSDIDACGSCASAFRAHAIVIEGERVTTYEFNLRDFKQSKMDLDNYLIYRAYTIGSVVK